MSGPEISVIITTRNRADHLDMMLQSLQKVSCPPVNWNVVLVNNDSQDHTEDIVNSHVDALPIQYLHERRTGKNRALNHALDSTNANFIVFTDDDVLVDKNWLVELWSGANRYPDDAIFGGQILPLFPRSTPRWMTDEDFFFKAYAFSCYKPLSCDGVVDKHPFGPNFAVRRHVFNDRRFDEAMGPTSNNYRMGGETEFLLWAGRQGYRYIYLSNAKVQHVITRHQIQESHLLQRAYNAGRGIAAMEDNGMLIKRTKLIKRLKPRASTINLYYRLITYRLKIYADIIFGQDRPDKTFKYKAKMNTIRGMLHESKNKRRCRK